NERIIEREVGGGGERVAVIGFENPLRPGVRELAVADENAQAAGVEEGLVNIGNVVDDAGDADRVVRPAPALAVDRDPARDRAVDVGEIPRLDLSVAPSGAREYADRVVDLLLEIDAHAGAAVPGTHRGDVGRLAGRLRERDGVGESAGTAAAEIARDFELAGLAPQLVTFLDFPHRLKLAERRIEGAAERTDTAGGRGGEIEQAGAQGPA